MRTAVLAALVAAPLGVVAAGPATAAADPCEFVPTSLRADNLREDSEGQDEIFLKVGGQWWPGFSPLARPIWESRSSGHVARGRRARRSWEPPWANRVPLVNPLVG